MRALARMVPKTEVLEVQVEAQCLIIMEEASNAGKDAF